MAFAPYRSPLNSAPVGYKGRVIIFGTPVRVATCGVMAKQAIDAPSPATTLVDQPMWRVMPISIEGDIRFPLTEEVQLVDVIAHAVQKRGRQLVPGEISVQWPPSSSSHIGGSFFAGSPAVPSYGRVFTGCVLNKLTISATAGEAVNVTLGVIGLNVEEKLTPNEDYPAPDMTKVVTWDNVFIDGLPTTQGNGNSCWVKELSITVDNHCSPNFAFDSICVNHDCITPSSITTGYREVTGSLTFLGTAPTQPIALNNLTAATSEQNIGITFVSASQSNIASAGGVSLGGLSGGLRMKFNRVVYEWQDLEIDAGLVTARVNWRAYGDGPGTAATEILTYG